MNFGRWILEFLLFYHAVNYTDAGMKRTFVARKCVTFHLLRKWKVRYGLRLFPNLLAKYSTLF